MLIEARAQNWKAFFRKYCSVLFILSYHIVSYNYDLWGNGSLYTARKTANITKETWAFVHFDIINREMSLCQISEVFISHDK